jgi:hypothetical protein
MSFTNDVQACWTNKHWKKKMSHLNMQQNQIVKGHELIRLQQQTTKENGKIKPWRKPWMQLKEGCVH